MQSAPYEPIYHADPAFPVTFHLDRISIKDGGVEPHWHEGIEILYCIGGTASVIYEMEPHQMEAGAFVIIPSGAIHYISPTPENDCRYYCLIVQPAQFPETLFPLESTSPQPVIRDAAMNRFFGQIIGEMEEKRPYYKEAVTAYIRLLFTEIFRYHCRPTKNAASARQQEAVKQGILYLRAHFREKITIDQVCGYLGFSKYYYCHMFKKVTGRSIMDYVLFLRCSNARRLLESGRCSISECAMQSGFSDVSYFTRVFKAQMGKVPSSILAERRENKNLPSE